MPRDIQAERFPLIVFRLSFTPLRIRRRGRGEEFPNRY
jgi:hypothetical protein